MKKKEEKKEQKREEKRGKRRQKGEKRTTPPGIEPVNPWGFLPLPLSPKHRLLVQGLKVVCPHTLPRWGGGRGKAVLKSTPENKNTRVRKKFRSSGTRFP